MSMPIEAWEVLDRKTLGTIRLCLAASVAFNHWTKDNKRLNTLYGKPSASIKVFLMNHLFNLKMLECGNVASHLNNFNSIYKLAKICITKFQWWRSSSLDCSLPENWDSFVMAVSNYVFGANTLVFDDLVGVRKCQGKAHVKHQVVHWVLRIWKDKGERKELQQIKDNQIKVKS